MADDRPFWETKRLGEMTPEEWESLCDGCGQCCTLLLEDEDGEDPPEVFLETSLCCRLFDPVARRCTRYAERKRLVPECVKVTAKNVRDLTFMPETCAYRLLADGRPLPSWHPLKTGRRESVAEAGIAVSPGLTSEALVDPDDLFEYVTGERRVRRG